MASNSIAPRAGQNAPPSPVTGRVAPASPAPSVASVMLVQPSSPSADQAAMRCSPGAASAGIATVTVSFAPTVWAPRYTGSENSHTPTVAPGVAPRTVTVIASPGAAVAGAVMLPSSAGTRASAPGAAAGIVAVSGVGPGSAPASGAGTAELIGSPAEEGGGGKVLMARQGAFDGVDAAMMVHPADADLTAMDTIAIHQLDVRYTGQEAREIMRQVLADMVLEVAAAIVTRTAIAPSGDAEEGRDKRRLSSVFVSRSIISDIRREAK